MLGNKSILNSCTLSKKILILFVECGETFFFLFLTVGIHIKQAAVAHIHRRKEKSNLKNVFRSIPSYSCCFSLNQNYWTGIFFILLFFWKMTPRKSFSLCQLQGMEMYGNKKYPQRTSEIRSTCFNAYWLSSIDVVHNQWGGSIVIRHGALG